MAPKEPENPTNPVRMHRRALRLTQAELATTVGVSRQTVIAIEQGNYAPTRSSSAP